MTPVERYCATHNTAKDASVVDNYPIQRVVWRMMYLSNYENFRFNWQDWSDLDWNRAEQYNYRGHR